MKFFLLMTLFSCAATYALADRDENESGLISDASSKDNEVAGQFEEENDEEMEDDDETNRWLAPEVYDYLAERERRSVNASQIAEEKELEKKKNKRKGEGKGGKKKNKNKNKKNKKNKNKKKKKKPRKYTEKEKKAWFARVGCFEDKGPAAWKNKSLRALKTLYRNERGKLDWKTTWEDFSSVVMDCSTAAQIEGCPCFGVQFFAECWCDKACKTYNVYGRSERCFRGVVGLNWTNFVYRGRCGSVHGCCKDGAMPASGPNYKGCPDCTTAVDLIFVVDASGSIGIKNFRIIKKILLKIIRHFSVSSYHTRIGIVKYSTSARAVLRLPGSQRKGYRGVAKAIRKMKYSNGGTHTGKAIVVAEKLLTGSKRRLRGRFVKHEQAVVVLTDGLTNPKDVKRLKAASDRLKKIAHVIAVGVTGKGYDRKNQKKQQQELGEIASTPEDLFYQLNFTQVLKHVDPIAKRACPLVYKIKGKK